MRLAALFHPKAKAWIEGRKGWRKKLKDWRGDNPESVYWFHCASVGEFEQGRPVMEAIREKDRAVKIVLTFFSPSGYEMRKTYRGADLVMYLPADTPRNASSFVQTLEPAKVFFIKYEYWANYFFSCRERQIPLYIISGILRADQRFFGTFKSFWNRVLACVSTFFVQNKETAALLQSIGITQVVITGDTRYDRVLAISKDAPRYPKLETFVQDDICVVGGSTWPPDEQVLRMVYDRLKGKVKLIIVPHELSEAHLSAIHKMWPEAVRYTQLNEGQAIQSPVMILDTMGMLSAVYRYASLAHIGGGFGSGIHNTLEAAVWGIPVSFGPRHLKFQEAADLLEAGAAVTAPDQATLAAQIADVCENTIRRAEKGQAARALTLKNTGATTLILNHI
jgi:3-deoxy-D-manno-octulosonic-acid transferase